MRRTSLSFKSNYSFRKIKLEHKSKKKKLKTESQPHTSSWFYSRLLSSGWSFTVWLQCVTQTCVTLKSVCRLLNSVSVGQRWVCLITKPGVVHVLWKWTEVKADPLKGSHKVVKICNSFYSQINIESLSMAALLGDFLTVIFYHRARM